MNRAYCIIAWLGIWLTLSLVVARADDAPPQKPNATPYAADLNKKWADPKADVKKFIKSLESQKREVFAKRHEITCAVGLRPGDAVADIGAGTGLFSFLFAEQVGCCGAVYAVDIAPAMVGYIAEQAKQRGYEQVVSPVLNSADSARLPPDSIDVAFICETYHHFEHPQEILTSIHAALRPGGRLVLVDLDVHEHSDPSDKKCSRASKEVYCREIAAAGFELIETPNAPEIKGDFYAEFRVVKDQPTWAPSVTAGDGRSRAGSRRPCRFPRWFPLARLRESGRG